VLGCTSLFASALLTGGVGPWLPFQMLCSAWVGMGAGLLPRRVTGRAEIAMLAAYGVVAAYVFGILMNLSSWPFVLGIAVPGHTGISFVAGDPLGANLHRFLVFTLITSTGSFDTGRAITTAVAIAVLGQAVLTTLRRAARRALVVGSVETPVPPDEQPPSVSPPVDREEAAMSAPHSGLRDQAGSQI
jgi:energy-coupling factor transport system substrate-specific component